MTFDEVRCPHCYRYMGAFIGKAQCRCGRWLLVKPTDTGPAIWDEGTVDEGKRLSVV